MRQKTLLLAFLSVLALVCALTLSAPEVAVAGGGGQNDTLVEPPGGGGAPAIGTNNAEALSFGDGGDSGPTTSSISDKPNVTRWTKLRTFIKEVFAFRLRMP